MHAFPDRATLRAAIKLAGRAPSLFNVQPWQWRVVGSSLHLFFDSSRALPATDPHDRELTLSCGATLHHAVVALRGLGWRAEVQRLPNPAEPELLATLDIAARVRPSVADITLAEAAHARYSDRRPYADREVPGDLLDTLVRAGRDAGADVLVAVDEQRYCLAQAFVKASAIHGATPEYRAELAAWTGRDTLSTEGVPGPPTPEPGTQYGDLVLRDFGRVAVAPGETGSERTAGSILVISTSSDNALAYVRAGEATSAVLCAATSHGLASSPLSEAFEIDQTRTEVRHGVLADHGYPQLAVRVGWPAGAQEAPPTQRRPVHEVLRDRADDQPGSQP